MVTLWFALAALMVAGYVVLDGFDFGAGALHRLVARDDRERRQVLAAIGPYWDGNEVWLLAGGGALFLAFPKVLAAGLSGFYLAVFMLIWVLILRGISIEFRSHVADAQWRGFWDGVFAFASTLAPVLLGAALGNVLRGVPLDADGWFAVPLFDSFSPTGALGLLDWYTLLCAVTALVAIAHHGALFLAWKTDGPVRERSRAWAARLFPALLLLWAAATLTTFQLAPHVPRGLAARPLAWGAAALTLLGLVTSARARRRGRDLLAFLGSAAFLLGVLGATAACVYPVWLPSTLDPAFSLTAEAHAAAPESLRAGLLWWPAGLVLALGYLALLFRLHRGKARAPADGQGY
jgi:cytochrome bd ubiquinol oxidase subunit II